MDQRPITSLAAVIALILCLDLQAAKPTLDIAERSIIFAVLQEAKAADLSGRRDVCLGFGHGLVVQEKLILSELASRGLVLHKLTWCSNGPRGLSIDVIPPVEHLRDGVVRFRVDVGDLYIPEGVHFATMLRSSVYAIQCCDKHAEPKLISYKRTCCPEIK
jgi:hypothetical protein